MKSFDILDSENNSEFEGEHNEFVHKENARLMFKKIIYIPTLPSTFNSLVEKTVKLETEEPQCVIELLGDLLGVKDYKTNKAAFWFLDIVALQVLRYKNCLDGHYRSILIIWLAGDMKLIREKKITDNARKDQIMKDFVIPPTPPSSLNEEEILANNCPFILPLIEANEAAQIFEMHAGSM
ncbi:hypothetical protein ALC62_08589 [Cyphomyrmex costatus]|uniref:Uncharacterized protein n=1 Tax=Cyphomyrmex costatus TaxID=456900 RepID=A0A151IGN9_9HYME|nr:hypothetical protein ALC62_08589 [Cyphomyrmex costatus]